MRKFPTVLVSMIAFALPAGSGASQSHFESGRDAASAEEVLLRGKWHAAIPHNIGGSRQRRKGPDPLLQWKMEQRREEENKKRQEEALEKKRKEQKTLADNKRWEETRTDLQNRFHAIDVKLVLDDAKSDFTSATNRFSASPTPEFTAHTNRMVKLTKQFVAAQRRAQCCLNPNAVLSQVEVEVVHFEQAHEALREEIGALDRPAFPESPASARGVGPFAVSPRRNNQSVENIRPETPAESATPADRLRGLKQLFDEGVLTQEEYDAKKKELIESL